MSQEGNKYKIQIVKAGIGDPFLIVNVQFLDNNGFSPVSDPIQDFEVKADVAYTLDGEYQRIGKVYSHQIAGMGPYRLGIPFDRPPGWNPEEDVYVKLTFENNGQTDFIIHDHDSHQVTIHMETMGGVAETFEDEVYYKFHNPV